jgi:acetolactate synthase-1/2/3 large subunit
MMGYEILAKSLHEHDVDAIFYLLAGPMVSCANQCAAEGISVIDVRHEQAAAMMAIAHARLLRKPAVCMAGSGPGTTNLITGIATAWADGSPVIAIGGSSSMSQLGMPAFQEVDQVALFEPITRSSERCYETRRIPEYVDHAFHSAFGFHPGPAFLDMPADVLYNDIPEEEICWAEPPRQRLRSYGDPAAIDDALNVLADARRPVLISGSGVLWSQAEHALRAFVEQAGIPFWTTPQGRGVIPEDHPLSFLAARSTAFKECDAIVQVGTRQNYLVGFMRSPRWSTEAKLIQIDIDPEEIGRNRHPTVGIAGDAKAILEQLTAADGDRLEPSRYAEWVSRLRALNEDKLDKASHEVQADQKPMHPIRLCQEIRDWLPRDAVLVVDGHEILSYARQTIPFYSPQSLNSGPFGCMGVGLPLGIGAQVALPGALVVVLHGDGSFGLNAMEMDTAIRHNLPVICIISNNGGWTAEQSNRPRVGRHLGFTRYDLMFDQLGAFTRYVEDPGDIKEALEAAVASKKPAVINVITDPYAMAPGSASTSEATTYYLNT